MRRAELRGLDLFAEVQRRTLHELGPADALALPLRELRGHVVGMDPNQMEAARRTEAALRALHQITLEERAVVLHRAEALHSVAQASRQEAEATGGPHGAVRDREADLYDREAEIVEGEAKTLEREAATEKTKADSARQRAAGLP